MQKAAAVTCKIRELIKRGVGRLMKPFGLTHVEVDAGEDYDGDPILIIEARYKLSERHIDPTVLSQLTTELRYRLWKGGARRFPNIDHCFVEGQKVVGYRGVHGLIVTARRLARTSPNRPRQADLRRATSTAYYALFQAMAKDVADLFAGAGPNRPDKAWRHAYRALDHGTAKNACAEVRNLRFPGE